MTARVEPETISKIPFQFPKHNLFRPITTAGSQFYPYKLKPKNGNPVDKTTETSDKTFFKEYCLTGSGHPSGFTYGWVSNDDKNLYVKLDFTPDNTRDGDKDYAKLYVRSGKNLKEFKVSEVNTKWGRPEFTYTDNASYQHKVYNFTIPLGNLDLDQSTANDKIDLAFAAYGTATPGYLTTDAAFDEEYRRYLIVYVNQDGYVAGQLVNQDGSLFETEFLISNNPGCNYPSIVHNRNSTNFLVLFERNIPGIGYSIEGQIVLPDDPDPSPPFRPLQGSNFIITDEASTVTPANASGAFDYHNNQFMVVWEDSRNPDTDIYGQVLLPGGVRSGSDFAVTDATGNQYDPAIAFDGNAQKYLVAFTDTRNGDYWDIYGQVDKYRRHH